MVGVNNADDCCALGP